VEFEWDPVKDRENQEKHGVAFEDAVLALRFSRTRDRVRIFGAGYWREGRTIHEQANRFRR
jgi:uncharacterized DUF497 family protein